MPPTHPTDLPLPAIPLPQPSRRRGAVAAGLLAWAAASSGALASAQTTQQVCVPDADASQGTVSTIPMGAKGPAGSFQNMRTQIRVPKSFLPPTGAAISEVALAGGGDGDYLYTLLEVRLAHLPTGTTFSGTLQQNLSGESVVLSESNARRTMTANQWVPLGLTSTFQHDGARDLVVDITIQGTFFTGATPGTRRSSTLETVYALNYDPANPAPAGWGPFLSGAKVCLTVDAAPAVTVVGTGCPAASGTPVAIGSVGAPVRAASFRVEARSAPPLTAGLLIIGTDSQSFGLIGLPLDLAVLGAPGCLLRTDIGFVASASTDATGYAFFDVAVPGRAALAGQRVLFQWAVVDLPANPLGLVTSGMLDTVVQ